MSLKIPFDALNRIVDDFTAVAAIAKPMRIHLYQNNHTPADADLIGDYTECTFSGYAAADLVWGAAVHVTVQAQAVATAITFAHNGGGTANQVYGYYITDQTDTDLLFAELDPSGPRLMQVLGDQLVVHNGFTYKSEF